MAPSAEYVEPAQNGQSVAGTVGDTWERVGSVFVVAAALLAWFMIVSGWAVLRVSVMAIWATVIVLPTLWLGAVPGAPQRRAADVVWQFFTHGIQTLIYIVYVSVVGLAVERIVSAPLPVELGGTNPFAHVLMMGGVALAALMLLRHIRTDVSGRPSGGGLWRQASSVAIGMGMTAALGGVGSAAAQGIRGLRRRSGSSGEPAPWERMDAQAAVVHGAAEAGFDPVPAWVGMSARVDQRENAGTSEGGHQGGSRARGVVTCEPIGVSDRESQNPQSGVAPMVDQRAGTTSTTPDRGQRAKAARTESEATATTLRGKASSVPAISEMRNGGHKVSDPEESSVIDTGDEPPTRSE